jgi:hypothetical protein
MHRSIAAGLAAAAILVAGTLAPSQAAWAQTAGPKLSGSDQKFFKQRKRVAIPAYHVTYITQQQGTAVASIAARSRLNLMLEGVDDATMQALADEAHADLVAQFKAAGFDVLSDAEAVALTAGVAAAPNNRDVVAVGPSITIGKSVKMGWTAMGAQAAPLLTPFHNPSNSPMGRMASMDATGKLGGAARDADAVAVIPQVVIDFADMEAKTGGDFLGRSSAGVSSNLRFGLRAGSGAQLVSAFDRGPAFAGGWSLLTDYPMAGSFATIQEGAAGVRVGSMGATTDQNYQIKDRARGDAVVVDLPAWKGLVQQAYRAQNAAIVAAAVKGRG